MEGFFVGLSLGISDGKVDENSDGDVLGIVVVTATVGPCDGDIESE